MGASPKKLWDKNKFPPLVALAIGSLFAAPIITVFFVPPDSQLPIIISAYLTLFWILVLCVWIWTMIFGVGRDRRKNQKAIREAIQNGIGNAVKMKHGMVADLDILRSARHEDLMVALSYAINGSEKALKKLDWRAFWAGCKFAIWITVLLLLIPFVALQHINPYIIVGWIFLLFIHIPYSYLRDFIRNDEYVYESAAVGLKFDKKTRVASGQRYGKNIEIYFMDHGCETTVKADAGTFTANVKKRKFQVEGGIPAVESLFQKLTDSKRASLWNKATITSDGRKIQIKREYRGSENTAEMDYWLCDLWLAEWLASGKEF